MVSVAIEAEVGSAVEVEEEDMEGRRAAANNLSRSFRKSHMENWLYNLLIVR